MASAPPTFLLTQALNRRRLNQAAAGGYYHLETSRNETLGTSRQNKLKSKCAQVLGPLGLRGFVPQTPAKQAGETRGTRPGTPFG